MYDMEIERRPYHRNCSCVLHKLKDVAFNDKSQQKNISFSRKQSSDYCSLSLTASKLSPPPSPSLVTSSVWNGGETKMVSFYFFQ